jgi:hypothetical protein
VTWFDSDHMSANAPPNESEVADYVENFVTDKFIGKSQRFLA